MERDKQVRSEFNKSESDIIEEYRKTITSKRLSLARRRGSDFDVNAAKSSKCLEAQKSLNTTAIVST